jgi:hypothetical protein
MESTEIKEGTNNFELSCNGGFRILLKLNRLLTGATWRFTKTNRGSKLQLKQGCNEFLHGNILRNKEGAKLISSHFRLGEKKEHCNLSELNTFITEAYGVHCSPLP